MMKNILIRLIGQSNNPGRHSLIQQWNMDPTYKFDKMYSQLRTIVLAQNEPVGPYPSMPSVVGSSSAAAVLPTTQQTTLVANAALTNPHENVLRMLIARTANVKDTILVIVIVAVAKLAK